MNFKKILTAATASVLAVSAMSVVAFAEDAAAATTFVDSTGKGSLDNSGKGAGTRIIFNLTDVMGDTAVGDIYGVSIVFDTTNWVAENGVGGNYIFSTKGNNWNAVEWGNEGSGKTLTLTVDEATSTATLTRMETEPFFTETDISGAEGEYANIAIDTYWGAGSLEVKEVKMLGKPADENPDDENKPTGDENNKPTGDENNKPTGDENKPTGDENKPDGDKKPVDTGVAGIAAVVGVAVIAAGAMVVAKKRK